jgi:hypothetical protein
MYTEAEVRTYVRLQSTSLLEFFYRQGAGLYAAV